MLDLIGGRVLPLPDHRPGVAPVSSRTSEIPARVPRPGPPVGPRQREQLRLQPGLVRTDRRLRRASRARLAGPWRRRHGPLLPAPAGRRPGPLRAGPPRLPRAEAPGERRRAARGLRIRHGSRMRPLAPRGRRPQCRRGARPLARLRAEVACSGAAPRDAGASVYEELLVLDGTARGVVHGLRVAGRRRERAPESRSASSAATRRTSFAPCLDSVALGRRGDRHGPRERRRERRCRRRARGPGHARDRRCRSSSRCARNSQPRRLESGSWRWIPTSGCRTGWRAALREASPPRRHRCHRDPLHPLRLRPRCRPIACTASSRGPACTGAASSAGPAEPNRHPSHRRTDAAGSRRPTSS